MKEDVRSLNADYEKKYGFRVEQKSVYETGKGLSRDVVEKISKRKKEPQWMLDLRLKALDVFLKKDMPSWGGDLSTIDFGNITYYIDPTDKKVSDWNELPEKIKNTFDRLGVPEAERNFLGGAGAQFESSVVYHNLRDELAKQGVIFLDTDSGLQEHEELFKKWFGKVVPLYDNKFAALNTAAWSGGTFIYIPPNVKVTLPLQAYFRINAKNMGQFERTLIIADKGSEVTYLEGCTSPIYSSDSLHSAVVELVALEGAKIRYTTMQNWSDNVYNLVTKRAFAYKDATVEWLDMNMGCLAEGTKIATNPGLKPIEQIESGQKVITLNERTMQLEAKKVLATKFSGIKPTYNVVLEDGKREIIATDNHPFLTVQYDPNRPRKLGRYAFRWKPLACIPEGSRLVIPKELPDLGTPYTMEQPAKNRTMVGRNQYGAEYVVDTAYKHQYIKLPSESTEDLLWIFGLAIGDGNVAIIKSKKTGNNRFGGVFFSVPQSDPARKKLVSTMKNTFGLNRYTERRDKVVIIYNSLFLAEFFKLNGIDGNAHTKRVPKWVFGLPLKQKKAFLAGYIEADGMIIRNCGRLKSCNKELLEDLKNLAMSCGIEVNRLRKKVERRKITINSPNAPEKEYTSYVTHISGLTRLREFFSDENKDRVPRTTSRHTYYWLSKSRRIKMPDHLSLLRVTGIVPLGEKPTYDLEIEGSHNFIANGVFVHNSKLTMKYPSVYMLEPGARADILSIAYAGKGQHQDAGGKVIHAAPHTNSRIISKSVSKDGGRTSYRGLVEVRKGATNVKSNVRCDALLLDEKSRSDTYPTMKIEEEDVTIAHEAFVGKVGEEQLFYLMSRGLSENEAMSMIVLGFIAEFTKELPMEYAIEMNKLVHLNMEGAVG